MSGWEFHASDAGLDGTFRRWYPTLPHPTSSHDWKWRVPARLTSLTPPPIRNQAQTLFEMSRMLNKFNMNVNRIDGILDFAEFDEIHTALSPSLPLIFNHFKMALCVHS
jgi:hypothetical protein